MIQYKLTDWLPTTKKEVELRGWDELDVVLFSGDAYVDHPSFGAAVIGRVLESEGLKVAIVPQPNWRDDLRDFKKMGKPRLFFAISAGCMDSMVNHYTANKRLRSNDAYTPDGKAGNRPDYTTVVYANILKDIYPDVPIVIGGIEASLRRFSHYDYWSDSYKKSILADSKADLLIYGMGEVPVRRLIQHLREGKGFANLHTLPQVAFMVEKGTALPEGISLQPHEVASKNKRESARNFAIVERESNKRHPSFLYQQVGGKVVVVTPTAPMMSETEIDAVYALPFTRLPHPKYKGKTIPAFEMIKFSINTHRGCFGGCSFCTISMHQGKEVVSRSQQSVLDEVMKVSRMPDFKGYLSDLGGPSANMYKLRGKDLSICDKCQKPSCIFPSVCKNLNVDHRPMLELYRKVDALPAIKKSFIGSGVRYDMLLHRDSDEAINKSLKTYTRELIVNHVSGRLKVAPEHTSDKVLAMMRKPSFKLFKEFKRQFDRINQEEGLKQQIIPYFISSHPDCEEVDMAELAVETKSLNFQLEQVQDFTPTPMTLATEIYYTGLNPYTLKPVYVARTKNEKLAQQQFFFWYKSENRQRIMRELQRMHRSDLIQRLFDRPVRKG